MAPRAPAKGAPKHKGPQARKSATAGPSSSKTNKKPARPPPKQQKTKPGQMSRTTPAKKKARVYTDKELNLPALNMITPAGVQKPRGKKKGKIFVDDREGMMTIMALVNAEKEGKIESKMIRQRQLEEVREARRAEAEARKEKKEGKMEELKRQMKKGGRRGADKAAESEVSKTTATTTTATKKTTKPRKKVAFA